MRIFSKMVLHLKFRPRRRELCLCSFLLLAMLYFCLHLSLQSDSVPSDQNLPRAPKSMQKDGNNSPKPTIKPRKKWSKDEVMKNHTDSSKIPRIIHLTWKNSQLPIWTKDFVRKWRTVNPGWQVWFWSDAAADKFVQSKFKDYYDLYKGYGRGIQRADAMRYFVLLEFGGFYADLDVEPIRPLEPLRDEHACVLSTEPNAHARFCYAETNVLALIGDRVACNAVMACRPRHSFFQYVISMLPMVQKEKNPLTSTGPMMLTYRYIAFKYFMDNIIGKSPHRVLEKEHEIFLAPDVWFMPAYDKMQEGHLKKECTRTNLTPNQKEVCDLIGRQDYVNGPRDASLTNHHWVHTWIKGANKRRETETYDISEVIFDVVYPEEVFEF